jgi:hypothetical protein
MGQIKAAIASGSRGKKKLHQLSKIVGSQQQSSTRQQQQSAARLQHAHNIHNIRKPCQFMKNHLTNIPTQSKDMPGTKSTQHQVSEAKNMRKKGWN